MNKAYIPTLLTLILMAVLHFCATAWYWYVRFPGFDIIMHIIGGAGIAFALYWIVITFMPQHKLSFWQIIALAFIVGVVWELFEAVNNIAGAPVGTNRYYVDMIKDLCNDTLGAIFAAILLL